MCFSVSHKFKMVAKMFWQKVANDWELKKFVYVVLFYTISEINALCFFFAFYADIQDVQQKRLENFFGKKCQMTR